MTTNKKDITSGISNRPKNYLIFEDVSKELVRR